MFLWLPSNGVNADEEPVSHKYNRSATTTLLTDQLTICTQMMIKFYC